MKVGYHGYCITTFTGWIYWTHSVLTGCNSLSVSARHGSSVPDWTVYACHCVSKSSWRSSVRHNQQLGRTTLQTVNLDGLRGRRWPISVAVSWIPAEAARPGIQVQFIVWCACLLPSFHRYPWGWHAELALVHSICGWDLNARPCKSGTLPHSQNCIRMLYVLQLKHYY